MALIICPECKKEVSDQADVCVNCGYPIKGKASNPPVFPNQQPQQKKKEESKDDMTWCFVLAIVFASLAIISFGFKSICLLFQVISAIFAFVLCLSKNRRKKCVIVFSLLLISSILRFATPSATRTNDSNTDTQTSTEATTQSISKTDSTNAVQEVEPFKEYKATCKEFDYKEVMRSPENYVGQRVKIEIQISSVHEPSWSNDTKYYFGLSKDDTYDIYLGDRYGVYDYRDTEASDWFKILSDDVIVVYGEIADTEQTSSLILNSQEIFCINMRYAELISE